MKNKDIKVIFLPCSKWVFIIGGLIILAVVGFFLILTLEAIREKPNILFPIIIYSLMPFIVGLLFITRPFIPLKNGLSIMEITNSILFFTIYNKEKTKYEIKIPLQDIEKFHVDIDVHSPSKTKKIGNTTYLVLGRYDFPETKVVITVKCKDEQKYNFSYEINNFYMIKQLFSVVRLFPNFSYEVKSNLDVYTKTIHSFVQTGKGLGLIGYLKALFESKNILPEQKIVYKIVIGIMIALILLLISLPIIGYLKGTI